MSFYTDKNGEEVEVDETFLGVLLPLPFESFRGVVVFCNVQTELFGGIDQRLERLQLSGAALQRSALHW
jgi:hypothetical protein